MKNITSVSRKSKICRIVCLFYHCPRNVACFIFGKEAKPHHRIITGLVIITVGAVIGDMQAASGIVSHVLQGCCGRFVEAMGSVPIIEHLGSIANTKSSVTTPVVDHSDVTSSDILMEMENAVNGIPDEHNEHSNLTKFVS